MLEEVSKQHKIVFFVTQNTWNTHLYCIVNTWLEIFKFSNMSKLGVSLTATNILLVTFPGKQITGTCHENVSSVNLIFKVKRI